MVRHLLTIVNPCAKRPPMAAAQYIVETEIHLIKVVGDAGTVAGGCVSIIQQAA